MTNVLVLKNWGYPDFYRQTPGSNGIWKDIKFNLNIDCDPDYVIVLNHPSQKTIVNIPPEKIWIIIQEPPVGYFRSFHYINKNYSRVYGSHDKLKRKCYFHSYPVLHWQINRTYDQLKEMKNPQKTNDISCVMSNTQIFPGHRERLKFINSMKEFIDYDHYGYGIKPLDDKWDGLATYKYSIAIENFSNSIYWTEKIADCFLAWTMPVYYGCTKIDTYFPRESYIQIDINDLQLSSEIIKEAKSKKLWEKNYEAINYSRNLILEEYNFFNFVYKEIKKFEADKHKISDPANIVLYSTPGLSFLGVIIKYLEKIKAVVQLIQYKFSNIRIC